MRARPSMISGVRHGSVSYSIRVVCAQRRERPPLTSNAVALAATYRRRSSTVCCLRSDSVSPYVVVPFMRMIAPNGLLRFLCVVFADALSVFGYTEARTRAYAAHDRRRDRCHPSSAFEH